MVDETTLLVVYSFKVKNCALDEVMSVASWSNVI